MTRNSPPLPGELACTDPPSQASSSGSVIPAGPRFATACSERASYGGEVAKLARLLGFEPMPHQELIWDIALEHVGGVLVYREIVWTIARQCGKSVALLCLMLWRCLRWPGQVVRYGAQTGIDARAMLADTWWPRLEHSPLAEVLSFRRQSGHEALIFENTSRLGLLASTEKSAHGSTLDAACLDESWAHADHRLEQSCRPAMVTRESAQLYVVSTAGTARPTPLAARHIYLEEPHGEDGFWPRLRGLQADALFGWGRRDRLVPVAFARHVIEALPGARHVELDCGHVPQVERPRQTHNAIGEFLAEVS